MKATTSLLIPSVFALALFQGACGPSPAKKAEEQAASAVQHWDQGTPWAPAAELSPQAVDTISQAFDQRARATGIIGYKAALTSPHLQDKFGASKPVVGLLTKDMLRKEPVEISLSEGARLALEGDMLVRVKDASINTAQTDLEIAAALNAAIPFVEIPDLLFAPGTPINADLIKAINTGTRLGVIGDELPLKGTAQQNLDALVRFRVDIQQDKTLNMTAGYSTDLLGGPFESIRWIRDELAGQGISLKEGDLLSLGSMTPMVEPESGESYTAIFAFSSVMKPFRIRVTFVP